jgi:hypothetical protein
MNASFQPVNLRFAGAQNAQAFPVKSSTKTAYTTCGAVLKRRAGKNRKDFLQLC